MGEEIMRGKSAVITGARTGIGRAVTERFAREGVNLWACAHREDAAFERDMQELSEKYSVWIKPVYFDLEKEEEIKSSVRKIIMEKKPIDILVNNAGIFPALTAFSMTPVKEVRRIFEINFFSMLTIIQLVSKVMLHQKAGSVVNLSSTAGLDAEQGVIAYAASKAAVASATKNLAMELAPYGIRVNAVAPGLITTGINQHLSAEISEGMVSGIGLGREGSADEVADAVFFLASEQASYITGQVIRIDGGM